MERFENDIPFFCDACDRICVLVLIIHFIIHMQTSSVFTAQKIKNVNNFSERSNTEKYKS